ncbi:hypothetical protein J6E39_05805 [bacterium]|nr:hypothetical protein [bacterium]
MQNIKIVLPPPFVNAFTTTLNIFYDTNTSPYPISEDLYIKFSELDDIALGVIFQDINVIDIPFNNNDIYNILTEKLKLYIKFNGYELDESFYDLWKSIFIKEYERSFKTFFASDNSFCKDAIVDMFSISLESFNAIIHNQEIINQNLKNSTNEIITNVSNVSNQIQSLQSTLLSNFGNKEIDEDNELKKIQGLIDKYKYEDGIAYIELNKDDNWQNKSKEFKAKIYNKLGVCYENLNENINAKQAFKFSYELDSKNDNPLFNLAHMALDENDNESYDEYLKKFNNKNSDLYYRLVFLKYLCITQKFDVAKSYLETNLKEAEDYLFLKALLDLKNPKKISSKQAEKNLKEYINKSKQDNIIAKYNLVNCQFINLFNKSKLYFVFDINTEGILKIIPNTLQIKVKQTFFNLLQNLEDVLNGLNKTYKNHEYLITTIKIKIYLIKYLINKFEQDKVNIKEINDVIIKNKNSDDSVLLETLYLNILCNQYSKAHEIYTLLKEETKKLSKNNYIIILFGEQKYKEVLEQINEFNELNEQFKIISIYKEYGWEQTEQYIKNSYHNYSDQLLLLCIWLFHDNNYYDDELNLLKQISNNIIKFPNKYDCKFVYKIAHGLAFFNTEIDINKLREKLIEKYWARNKSIENFDIGMLNTIDLFNRGMYSKCLSNLEILEKYEPENVTIKNLYAQIDSINYNTDTLIENYEKGIREDFLLPLIARAYIVKKEYTKAETLINSLKYKEKHKLQYFYLKIELGVAKKIEDTNIIEIFVQGLQEFPDDLKLNQILFSFLLKSHTVNEQTRNLFQQCSKILEKNKLLCSFKIDMDNPIESLKQAIETFEPYKNYVKREKFFEDGLSNYDNFKYPLALTSELFGTKQSVLFANFIEDNRQIIALTRRTNDEYENEVNIINKNKNIIMAPQSLILLKALELDDIVFTNLKIKITAQTKNEINFILNDITGDTIEKLIRDKEGNPNIIFVKNKIYKYKEYLKNCLNALDQANFKSQSKKALALIEASEKLNSKDFLYDATVAVQNDYSICSSDEVTHILSKEFKYKDVSIISIINYLKENNIITAQKETELKYKLIEFNCKYIPLTAKEIYCITDLKLEKLQKTIDYLDEKFDKESVADVLSEYVYILNQDNNFSNSKIFEIIDLIFDKCKKLSQHEEIIQLFMEYLMRYHHFLSNLVQKYIACKFWETVSDKEYIVDYYKYVIRMPLNIKFNDKDQNIQEVKRIVFNAPSDIKQILNVYAEFIIKFAIFNSVS